jgi:hypothetical protein
VRCANCGGELPRPTRFCPHCSAPQPEFEGPAEAPRPVEPRLDETSVAAPERSRWAAAHASAVLVFLAAAIVVFALMAIALGWIGADVLGL